MIALIEFEKDKVLTKEEAEKLKLSYVPAERVGYCYYHGEHELHVMDSDDRYLHELFKKPAEKDTEAADNTYYLDQECTKEANGWRRFTPPTVDAVYVKVEATGHLVNLEEFVEICPYRFFVKKALPSAISDPTNIALALDKVTTKFNAMLAAAEKLEKSSSFNSKCNVHVGGGLITTYNELMLKEDVCTDMLQQELNKGWRIIAVCVQPDQRRPDYILGRYNPDLDPREEAHR